VHCDALQGVKRADRLLVVLEDTDEREASFGLGSEDAPQGHAAPRSTKRQTTKRVFQRRRRRTPPPKGDK
jgi:hypothetical protein